MDEYIKIPKYYKGLNGLRAISIIAVFLFHGNIDFVGKYIGWAGVDLFFVISGFLITGILVDSKDSKRFFKNFYLRRILRIFPIYYLIVLGVAFLYKVMSVSKASGLEYYLLYLQNFYTSITEEGYGLLAHTWSLAVEEQFYLIWPFLVYYFSIKNLIRISWFLIVSALILRFFFAINGYSINFQNSLIISRMDTLLLGSLIALFIRYRKYKLDTLNKFSNALIILGLFITITLFYSFGSPNLKLFDRISDGYVMLENGNFLSRFTYGNILFLSLAIIFSGIIIKISFQTSKLTRYLTNIFEFKFINYLGKISYGLYIYHWIIFKLVDQMVIKYNYEINMYYIFIVKSVMSLLLASISWKLIEKPFLNLKDKIAKYD